jgi:hypothetical protein
MEEYFKFWIKPLKTFYNDYLSKKLGKYETIDDIRDGLNFYIKLENIKFLDINLYKLLSKTNPTEPDMEYSEYICKMYNNIEIDKYLEGNDFIFCHYSVNDCYYNNL